MPNLFTILAQLTEDWNILTKSDGLQGYVSRADHEEYVYVSAMPRQPAHYSVAVIKGSQLVRTIAVKVPADEVVQAVRKAMSTIE